MGIATPLNADEELLWRSLLRLVTLLPPALDEDLIRDSGLTLTEYGVLMTLSEAHERQLRMAELAAAIAMSASRITRVVDDLRKRGLVRKERCAGDACGNVATLTGEGLARLQAAYPGHLASARLNLIDHLDTAETAALAAALNRIVTAAARPIQ